jgi:hypothetical protein
VVEGRDLADQPYRVNRVITCNARPLDQFSFPSGHTVHAVAFTAIAIAYYPRLAFLRISFAFLVALSAWCSGFTIPASSWHAAPAARPSPASRSFSSRFPPNIPQRARDCASRPRDLSGERLIVTMSPLVPPGADINLCKEERVAAYVIAIIKVTDPTGYEDYKKLAGRAIEACGGRYLVRGGRTDVLEGEWHPSVWWYSSSTTSRRRARGGTRLSMRAQKDPPAHCDKQRNHRRGNVT